MGCADRSGVGKTLHVQGKVLLDNNPLTVKTTVVLFKPDSAKGNASAWEPAGTVDHQGNYTLFTQGKKGAPPGWYKVIVTATEPRDDSSPGARHKRPVPRSLLPSKYSQAATTDLAIEVVENPAPGAYDLRLAQ